jgi:ABC-type nitrate/sulfonate/bicarbonate transport system permease component
VSPFPVRIRSLARPRSKLGFLLGAALGFALGFALGLAFGLGLPLSCHYGSFLFGREKLASHRHIQG